jgi:hypothetical protein
MRHAGPRVAAFVLVVAVAAAPLSATAQRAFGGRAVSNQGRGFNMGHDVPSTATARGSHGAAAVNKNTGNAAAYNRNTGTATTYNRNTNTATQYNKTTGNATTNTRSGGTATTYNTSTKNAGSYNGSNSAGAYNKNTGNAAVYNKNTGNMQVYNKSTGATSAYHYNRSGTNGYYYTGRVVANPVYVGPAWGWNRGVVWAPVGTYWGGGFWGPFAVGAATAALMGQVVYQNHTYTSYSVAAGSPGATLLSNYGLTQTPCGAPGQVVIYGPNFGIICANPNALVAAGNYGVNVNSLTIQSQ